MKRFYLFVCTIFLLFNSAIIQAQDSYVRSRYLPERKVTEVATLLMNLEKSGSRTITLDAVFMHPKEKLENPQEWIYIHVKSSADDLIYLRDNQGKLAYSKKCDGFVKFFVDGKELELESLFYVPFNEYAGKNGTRGFRSFRPSFRGKAIYDEDDKPRKGVFQEMFMGKFVRNNFLKVLDAKTVEVRIDEQSFVLTENQVKGLKEIAGRMTPQ